MSGLHGIEPQAPFQIFANTWQRLERRDVGRIADAMKDPGACRRYVEDARDRLRQRVAAEVNAP